VTSGKLMLAAFIMPLAVGASAYLKIERVMRRRFRPGAALPTATTRA
jgi:hypothetical protein